MCMYMCMYTCIMCTCSVREYLCMCVCAHTYMYVSTSTYMHLHIRMYVYGMHTITYSAGFGLRRSGSKPSSVLRRRSACLGSITGERLPSKALTPSTPMKEILHSRKLRWHLKRDPSGSILVFPRVYAF